MTKEEFIEHIDTEKGRSYLEGLLLGLISSPTVDGGLAAAGIAIFALERVGQLEDGWERSECFFCTELSPLHPEGELAEGWKRIESTNKAISGPLGEAHAGCCFDQGEAMAKRELRVVEE